MSEWDVTTYDKMGNYRGTMHLVLGKDDTPKTVQGKRQVGRGTDFIYLLDDGRMVEVKRTNNAN